MRRFDIMPNALIGGKNALPLAIVSALVLTFIITPFVRRLSLRAGILDIPRDGRRMHKNAVPLAGGAGMIAAFALVPALCCPREYPAPLVLLCLLCGAYGLADDVLALSAGRKLLLQSCLSLLATLFLGRAEAFSFFGYTVSAGALSLPLTALWIVFMMNAVNLTDGMDGLCAGTCAVSAAALSLILFAHGEGVHALLASALSGACLGFLFHNRAPARIFMGETGSAFLGFALAVLALPLFSAEVRAPLPAVLPVFLFPLGEAASSFLRRVSHGKNPFAPDKSHMHHVLYAGGLSVPLVCAVLYTFALLCALCALIYGANRAASLAVFAAAVVFIRLMLRRKA